MRVHINDQEQELPADTTVAELLGILGHHDSRGLAVAVNDNVYPRSGWAKQIVREGDRVTLIRAAAGG